MAAFSFCVAQVVTPEVTINDIQPLELQAMGIDYQLVILSPKQWLEAFGGSEYVDAGGMASWDGYTIFLRSDQLWLLAHEFSHIYEQHWETQSSALEPECINNPDAFTPNYMKNRGFEADYICSKTEIYARYMGEVVWPQTCLITSYWDAPLYSLAPFGLEQPECRFTLDYSNHPYTEAVSYYMGLSVK